MNKYYYEYKDDGDVKYCYPGTQTLINKFGIRNGQEKFVPLILQKEISFVWFSL